MYGMGDAAADSMILTSAPDLPISPFAGSQQGLLLADTIAANAPPVWQQIQFGLPSWLNQNKTVVYIGTGLLVAMVLFTGGRRR